MSVTFISAVKTQEEALALREISGIQTLPSLLTSVGSNDPIPPTTEEIFPCGAQSVALFNDDLQIKRHDAKGTVSSLNLAVENVPYKWDFLQFMVGLYPRS